METNGLGNSLSNLPNAQNINDVVDQADTVAGDVVGLSQENRAAQTAMGQVFYSLIQKLMDEAQSNSSSGA